MDHALGIARAILPGAEKLVHATLAWFLTESAAVRREESHHRRRLDPTLRRIDQNRILLTARQCAANESERTIELAENADFAILGVVSGVFRPYWEQEPEPTIVDEDLPIN